MRQLMTRSALVLVMLFACLLAGRTATPEADKLFNTGWQLFEKRAYGNAISELNKFVTTHPKDTRIPQAKFMLGRSYQHQKRFEQAIGLYRQVIAEAPGEKNATLRAATHYQIAECYWLTQQYEKAVIFFRNCLVLSGGDNKLAARVHYWMAECLYQLQRYAEARQEYADVPKTDPESELTPWAIYSIGMIELRQSQFDAAIAALEQVTNRYHDTEAANEATVMLGHAYSFRAQAQQEAKAKETDFRKALDLFTGVTGNMSAKPEIRQSATLALADTFYTLTEYDRANENYQKALAMLQDQKSSAAVKIQLRRGCCLYNAGQYREAVALLTEVASSAFKESAIEAQYWLGNSLYYVAMKEKNQQAYLDAIAALKRYRADAGDQAPEMPRAILITAFCLEDLGAAGDAESAAKALLAYQEIRTKWPISREAGHAQEGIARLTAAMPVEQLRVVVEKLPEGATWSVDLSLAQKDFLEGKFDQALAAAKKVLDTKPTGGVMAQAAYIMATCLQQTGRDADAVRYYRQAQEAAPTGELVPFILRGLTLAYLHLAEVEQSPQRYADARDAALALVKQPLSKGDMAQAYVTLGNVYTANRQFAEAMDAYEKVAKDYADVAAVLPLAYMGMADSAAAKKDTDEAIARYREVIRRFPDHEVAGQAFFEIGMKQAELKQYDEAVTAFKNVPALHKMADQAAYFTAWAYADQGKHEEANAQFVSVADQFPNSPKAADSLYRVGEYWLEKKQYPDALKFFNRAFQIVQPGELMPVVAYKLGASAFHSKNYPLAVIGFSKVVSEYPGHKFAQESMYMQANALDLQDQAALAREAYLQYLAAYPRQDFSLAAAMGVGRASVAVKQYAQARADLTKAKQLYEELKKVPGLLTDSPEKVDRTKATMAEVQFYLAQSYFEEINYSEACKQYAAVEEGIEPWISRARLQMAKCYGQLGNLQDARDVLQGLVTRYPKSDAAQQAPGLAKELGVEIKPPVR
ncbi:MAG: tetratricopeptide repeat protein [Armatimonadota bacterium]